MTAPIMRLMEVLDTQRPELDKNEDWKNIEYKFEVTGDNELSIVVTSAQIGFVFDAETGNLLGIYNYQQ